MVYPKFIVSNQKEESISIQRVNIILLSKIMGENFQNFKNIELYEIQIGAQTNLIFFNTSQLCTWDWKWGPLMFMIPLHINQRSD